MYMRGSKSKCAIIIILKYAQSKPTSTQFLTFTYEEEKRMMDTDSYRDLPVIVALRIFKTVSKYWKNDFVFCWLSCDRF